jgi:hypothetical protein
MATRSVCLFSFLAMNHFLLVKCQMFACVLPGNRCVTAREYSASYFPPGTRKDLRSDAISIVFQPFIVSWDALVTTSLWAMAVPNDWNCREDLLSGENHGRYKCSAFPLEKPCDEELRRMIGSCRNVGVQFNRAILEFCIEVGGSFSSCVVPNRSVCGSETFNGSDNAAY